MALPSRPDGVRPISTASSTRRDSEGAWPAPLGVPLHRIGPDDATAIGAVLLDCPRVTVVDGADRLTWDLQSEGQPRSLAVWRNLCGWPAAQPYRSIGVEPMLGSGFDLREDVPAAVVPACRELTWRLTVSAHRTSPAPAPAPPPTTEDL
jgi:hypothetical protein